MDTKMVDKNGKWYLNTGAFRMPDPESGTFFEPGIATKATQTAWADAQPTLQEVSPYEDEVPKPKTKK